MIRTKPCPNRNFLQSCYYLHDKHIGPKTGWFEIDLNWNSPDPNWTSPKCHLTWNMTWSKFDSTCIQTEWSICQVYQAELIEKIKLMIDLSNNFAHRKLIQFFITYHPFQLAWVQSLINIRMKSINSSLTLSLFNPRSLGFRIHDSLCWRRLRKLVNISALPELLIKKFFPLIL